jgi:hypothetical protein
MPEHVAIPAIPTLGQTPVNDTTKVKNAVGRVSGCKRWVATDLAPQETVRAVVARFQNSSVFIIAMLMSGAVPGSSLFLRP